MLTGTFHHDGIQHRRYSELFERFFRSCTHTRVIDPAYPSCAAMPRCFTADLSHARCFMRTRNGHAHLSARVRRRGRAPRTAHRSLAQRIPRVVAKATIERSADAASGPLSGDAPFRRTTLANTTGIVTITTHAFALTWRNVWTSARLLPRGCARTLLLELLG